MAEKNVFEKDGESDYSDAGSDTESEKNVDESDNDNSDNESVADSDAFDFDEEEEYVEKPLNQNVEFSDDDSDESDDDEDDEDENYLQKFKESLKTNVISEHHPELIIQNYEEVDALCTIIRDADGIIDDPLHRTLPFITKYEKAKVLGERAKQLNAGAEPFVEVGEDIVDGYLIALAEFEQKKIPMVVRRPLPNGGSEFWRLADLEVL